MTKADEVLDAFRELEVGDVVEFKSWITKRMLRGKVTAVGGQPSSYIRVLADTETYMRYRDELTYVPQ